MQIIDGFALEYLRVVSDLLFGEELLQRQQLRIMLNDIHLHVWGNLPSSFQQTDYLVLQGGEIKKLIFSDQLSIILIDYFKCDIFNKY